MATKWPATYFFHHDYRGYSISHHGQLVTSTLATMPAVAAAVLVTTGTAQATMATNLASINKFHNSCNSYNISHHGQLLDTTSALILTTVSTISAVMATAFRCGHKMSHLLWLPISVATFSALMILKGNFVTLLN